MDPDHSPTSLISDRPNLSSISSPICGRPHTRGSTQDGVRLAIDGADGDDVQQHQYSLNVPIALPLPCRFCPGRLFNTHAALSKHLKKDHVPRGEWRFVFKCNGCRSVFDDLKSCNNHRKKTACQSAGPMPEDRQGPQHAAETHRPVRTRAPRIQGPVALDPPAAAAQPGTTPCLVGAQVRRAQFQCATEHQPGVLEQMVRDTSTRSVGSPASVCSIQLTPSSAPIEQHFSPGHNNISNIPQNGAFAGPSAAHSLVSEPSQLRSATPNGQQLSPGRTHHSIARVNVQHHPNAKQREWIQRFNCSASPQQLEATLDELVATAKRMAKVEPRRMPVQQRQQPPRQQPNRHGRRRNPMNADDGPAFDPVAVARIQKLYRSSRARAYRDITEQTSPLCQLSAHVIHRHFSEVFGPSPLVDDRMPAEVPLLEPANDNDPFSAPFNITEVSERLKRCSNSAPGPDNIRYAVWKKFDPGCHVLTAVFNAVKRLHHIPSGWRCSTTVLLYKKGDRNDMTNWRPITLSDTIGKLHSAVLAQRLALWAIHNSRISRAQKGFMPVDGCCEHNFVLQSIIQDARRDKQHCAIAWLDLTNAFGSIPHEMIVKSLRWIGLSNNVIDTIRLLYTDNTTKIWHISGLTDDIPIRAGVKQGCPLSPIIFNLALELILHALESQNIGYRFSGRTTSVLAYADDLVIIAPSTEQLQQQLDTTTNIANWAQLRFNPRKCATMAIDGKRKAALPTTFTVQQQQLPTLTIEQHYEHLGVPTGYHRAQSAPQIVERMSDHVDQIDRALLAPWQKFDAVNTFVLPSIAFHLKNGEVRKGPLKTLDKKITRAAKRWLNLPQRAGVEPLFLNHAMGGLALTPLNILADVSQVVHGLRLLTSRDLATTATDLLRTVVTKRLHRPPHESELAKYLNGSMDDDMGNETTDISSTWTRLRTATRRLRPKIDLTWTNNAGKLELFLNGCQIQPKTAEFCLRSAVRDFHHRRLLAKPDQGKVHSVTSINAASNHFMAQGNFTRFADWRFVHRARLDCVPLNGTRRFGQTNNKRCRRCGYDNETLPHVLCHCPPMLATIGRRHKAQKNLAAAEWAPENAMWLWQER